METERLGHLSVDSYSQCIEVTIANTSPQLSFVLAKWTVQPWRKPQAAKQINSLNSLSLPSMSVKCMQLPTMWC